MLEQRAVARQALIALSSTSVCDAHEGCTDAERRQVRRIALADGTLVVLMV